MGKGAITLAILLYSGCSTTRYIATPCPDIQPLPKLSDIRFHVEKGQIDKNATVMIISWMRAAKKTDRYYHSEVVSLSKHNKGKQ